MKFSTIILLTSFLLLPTMFMHTSDNSSLDEYKIVSLFFADKIFSKENQKNTSKAINDAKTKEEIVAIMAHADLTSGFAVLLEDMMEKRIHGPADVFIRTMALPTPSQTSATAQSAMSSSQESIFALQKK